MTYKRLFNLLTWVALIKISSSEENIEKAFQLNEIVPQIVNSSPGELLKVKYGSEAVNLGTELSPKDVENQPEVVLSNSSSWRMLIMIDPDAPKRTNPIFSEIIHWMVVNIENSSVGSGVVLFEYIGAHPPKNTGLHRYVFLVFEQSGRLEYKETYHGSGELNGRIKFSLKKFVDEYKLEGPVAGNFFQAQYD